LVEASLTVGLCTRDHFLPFQCRTIVVESSVDASGVSDPGAIIVSIAWPPRFWLPREFQPAGGGMQIAGSVALVTGAGRGLGRVFAEELVSRGAVKVYGAARDPAAVTEAGVTPIALDVTDPEGVARVAEQCADVSLLVNNAGVMKASTFIDAPSLDAARLEMETNYFGTLRMCRAFAPVLAANGGGAVVNMLSIVSFFSNPFNGSYGASKAAAWSLTNGIRTELHHQGTLVVGVHAGFIDTEMVAGLDVPKITPESVALQVFDAVEADQVEVLADERTRSVKESLPRDHELIYPPIQELWDSARKGRS
jgi:NAD(P)-dependent dehydrogenase (short-subunit alcohol dehydrogenase family)